MSLIVKLRPGFLFNYFPWHKGIFHGNSGDSPNSVFAV